MCISHNTDLSDLLFELNTKDGFQARVYFLLSRDVLVNFPGSILAPHWRAEETVDDEKHSGIAIEEQRGWIERNLMKLIDEDLEKEQTPEFLFFKTRCDPPEVKGYISPPPGFQNNMCQSNLYPPPGWSHFLPPPFCPFVVPFPVPLPPPMGPSYSPLMILHPIPPMFSFDHGCYF